MDVINRLAAFRIAVGHEPETPFTNTLFPSDFVGDLHQVAHEMGIFLFEIKDSGNMFLGDHKCMDRCLGVNVFKGKGNVIFVHYF